jgi:hypothetical protein
MVHAIMNTKPLRLRFGVAKCDVGAPAFLIRLALKIDGCTWLKTKVYELNLPNSLTRMNEEVLLGLEILPNPLFMLFEQKIYILCYFLWLITKV